MSQYTMLGGYKIDVETEPYDKGSFDTDYSKSYTADDLFECQ